MNKLKKNTFTEEFKYDIVEKIKPLERKTIEDEWLKISNMYKPTRDPEATKLAAMYKNEK